MALIDGGFIILSRKLIESEIWRKPPLYLKIWIYLLSRAQHKPYKQLDRGQLRTSIPDIIEDCSWYVGYRKEKPTKDQVYQVINWLRKVSEEVDEEGANTPMITTTKATQALLINIVNYDFYQNPKNYESNKESNDENDTRATREQRQPNNINKNVKNDKNANNISSCEDEEELKFPVESIEYRLADYLRKHILKNNPKIKIPSDKDMDKWSQHIDYMIRLDGRSSDDIKTVIEFSQKDDFWMTNILSTAKLRKQFDQLYLKSQQKNKPTQAISQPPKQKTKFHLAKSRGDKYSAEELESLILNNQKNRRGTNGN